MDNRFFNGYPYTDFHELNLSWVISELRSFATTLEQFVSINALKYADPIDWSITTQYEKNTIVIDAQTGTAYISVAPVPSGVALTNTDYWTVVFDLGMFIVRAAQNFTHRWEQDTTLTATFPTTAGDWLVWGDVLYRAKVNIIAGDTYVVDSNIEHFTMEEILGHIENLTTSDKTNLVAAINELVSRCGELNDLTTTDKTNLVSAINEVLSLLNITTSRMNSLFITPQMYGAVADGITDDTSAIQAAINSGDSNTIFFPPGTYMVNGEGDVGDEEHGVTLRSNINIILDPAAIIKHVPTDKTFYNILYIPSTEDNIKISGGTLEGERDEHIGSTGEHGYGIRLNGTNVTVENVNIIDCWGDGICCFDCENVTIKDCTIDNNRRQGITVSTDAYDVKIVHNTIKNTNGTAPQYGIDVEPDWNYSKRIVISDNYFEDNVGGSILMYGGHGTQIVQDVIISDNIMNEVNYADKVLSIANCTNVEIHGNVIKSSTGKPSILANTCFNLSFDNNVVNSDYQNSFQYVENSKVCNNVFTHSNTWIDLQSFGCKHVAFDGNVFNFEYSSATDITSDNIVMNFYTLAGDNDHITTDCTFNNNIINNVTTKTVVYVSNGSTKVQIKNNSVSGTINRFCELLNSGHAMVIMDNNFVDLVTTVVVGATSNDIVYGNTNGSPQKPYVVTKRVDFTMSTLAAGGNENILIAAADVALSGYTPIGIAGVYIPRPLVSLSDWRALDDGRVSLVVANNTSSSISGTSGFVMVLYRPAF